MTQSPIPILCAGCNAKIDIRPDQLEQKLACAKCGEPIRVKDYDVLIVAKNKIAEERKAKERAEVERRRQEASALAELERQERERQREAKRAADALDKQFSNSEKPAAADSTPEYGSIKIVAFTIQAIAFIFSIICIGGLVVALLTRNQMGGQPSITLAIGCLAGLIVCIFYFAVAEILSAFREIARNVHRIAHREPK